MKLHYSDDCYHHWLTVWRGEHPLGYVDYCVRCGWIRIVALGGTHYWEPGESAPPLSLRIELADKLRAMQARHIGN